MNLQNEPGPAPRMEPAPNILLPNNSTNIQQNKALTSKISIFYAPVDQPWKLYKHVDLEWIYKILRSTKYKLITEKLRLIDPNDKDARKAYKQAHFDYATFAGTFSYHADKDLINRSCYFDVDLDHIGNMAALEAMKSRILSQYTPALLFISPSGDGLKLVYQIDPNQGTHLQFFEALTNYHKKEFGVEIDQKCKNPSRACFLPYDPKCIKPDNPTLLGSDFLTVYPPDKPLKSTTTEQRDNSDNDAEGEIIENQEEIIRRLKKGLEKQEEFTKGNRNNYISSLCCQYNRVGIKQTQAMKDLKTYADPDNDFSETEIEAIVRSTYSKNEYHGIAPMDIHESDQEEEQLDKQKEDPEKQEAPAPPPPRPPDPPETIEETPLMPIDGFPEFIKNYINENTRIHGTHRDLWAAAILAATSAALGQSTALKTKYENPPLLWIAVVGSSGVGKTTPFQKAFYPIHKVDKTAYDEYRIAKAQYKAAKKAKKKGDPLPQDIGECSQIVIIDSTPEKMAIAMDANPRGITILRDELHGLFMDFGRYSKSGEQQNMLSTWSQSTFKVSRVISEDLFISDPFANIFGGIQPGVLPEMAKDLRAINGFLPRFAFVYPDSIQAPMYINEEISPALFNYYNDYIYRLLSLTSYREVIKLSIDAEKMYAAFYNKNNEMNNSGNQPDYLNEVNAKLNIIVLRIAVLFHFSHWACGIVIPEKISAKTMQSAIELTEYFRITAKKVYSILNKTSTDTKDLIRQLHALGNSQNDIAKAVKVTQQYVSKILKQ